MSNNQILRKYQVYVYDLEYSGTDGQPISSPHNAIDSYEVQVVANSEEQAKDLAWDSSYEMTGYGLWNAEFDVEEVKS